MCSQEKMYTQLTGFPPTVRVLQMHVTDRTFVLLLSEFFCHHPLYQTRTESRVGKLPHYHWHWGKLSSDRQSAWLEWC